MIDHFGGFPWKPVLPQTQKSTWGLLLFVISFYNVLLVILLRRLGILRSVAQLFYVTCQLWFFLFTSKLNTSLAQPHKMGQKKKERKPRKKGSGVESLWSDFASDAECRMLSSIHVYYWRKMRTTWLNLKEICQGTIFTLWLFFIMLNNVKVYLLH